MIKTIIFDLEGVYFSDGTKQAINTISQQFKIPKEKVKNVLIGELGTKYRSGELPDSDFWNEAKKYWNLEIPSEKLARIWLEGYKPIEDTSNIIDRLKKSSYELIFLSDNVQQRVEYLDKNYSFLSKFKDGIFSHLVYTRKPDPAIYKMALEKATHSANECIYIDDKPELLKPAEELGMIGIVFENAKQLEKSLKNAGLEF